MQENFLALQIEELTSKLSKIERLLSEQSSGTHPQHFTKKECARFFGISLNTVTNWSKCGILKPYYVANRVYFKREDVLEVMFNQNKSA